VFDFQIKTGVSKTANEEKSLLGVRRRVQWFMILWVRDVVRDAVLQLVEENQFVINLPHLTDLHDRLRLKLLSTHSISFDALLFQIMCIVAANGDADINADVCSAC
jgi:hypothetical protein